MSQAPGTGQPRRTPGDAGGACATGGPVAAGAPLGLFLGLTVLATIVILVALLRRGAGVVEIDDEPSADDPAARHAAADAVQDAIEELEVGGGLRALIPPCFPRVLDLPPAHPVTPPGAPTPPESQVL